MYDQGCPKSQACQTLTSTSDAKRTANSNSNPTSTSAVTSFSSTNGPFMAAYSYSWSQYIIPTTVGTVMVTVNEATNQTWSSTIYRSEYETNGSLTLLTRTDTNAAGTVTEVVPDLYSVDMTITYPTNYFEAADEMTWGAILPITSPGSYVEVMGMGTMLDSQSVVVATIGADGTCCLPSYTLSPTPTHSPFTQTGSTNAEDPRGWLYTLVGVNDGDPWEQLDPSEVSLLWTHQSLDITYTGCPHTACNLTTIGDAAGASGVVSQANILATSTTTISSAASSSASPATNALPSQKPSMSISPSTESSPSPSQTSTVQISTGWSSLSKSASPEGSSSQTTIPVNTLSQTITPQITVPWSSLTHSTANSYTPVTQESNSVIIVSSQTSGSGSSTTIGSGSSTTVVASHTSDTQTIFQIGTPSSTWPRILVPITSLGFTPTSTAAIVIGDITAAPGSSSDYIISSQTLLPGSSITLGSGSSTTIVAMQTSNSRTILVADSSSYTISQQGVPPPAFTIWSSVVSANSASEYVIAGQTLSPGFDIVVSGTTVTDIGGYIWLGLGGPNEAASTSVISTEVDESTTPGTGVSSGTLSGMSSSLLPPQNSTTAPSSTSSSLLPPQNSTMALSSTSSSLLPPQTSTAELSTSRSGSGRVSISLETVALMLALLHVAML